MRTLLLASAVLFSSLAPSSAQAWEWGRFSGTGSYPSYAYTPSYYPEYSQYRYGQPPGYQYYTAPAYNAYYNGYYRDYNYSYISGPFAPPYRNYTGPVLLPPDAGRPPYNRLP